MTEKQFREEADKLLFNYSPWLQDGVSYQVDVKAFNEHLEAMDKSIMAIKGDIDEEVKRKVANEMRAKLVKFIADHG